MQTITARNTSTLGMSTRSSAQRAWLMLFSRSILFLLMQILIALMIALVGNQSTWEAWDESARWWTFIAFFANLGSLYLLIKFFAVEGKNYFDILRFSRATWKTDVLWFIGFSIIALPIAAAAPREPLAAAIFGNATTSTNLLFRPLPSQHGHSS